MMVNKRSLVFCAHFAFIAQVLLLFCIVFPNTVLYYYSNTAYAILYVCIAFSTYRISKSWFLDDRVTPSNKAVLITGCDSGFGNLLAKRLDSKGFHVFASCYFPEGPGATELKTCCSDRLQVLPLDVTQDESVEKALSFVKHNLGSNVFWALVNNAGVLKCFSIEFSSMKDFKDTMEVNALGQVRVTKAFLQMLKISKGRVVNVTSLAGRLSTLEMGAYTMSKRAAVGFTECLSQEMSVWGVRVISIEPQIFHSPMSCEQNVSRLLDEGFKKANEDILASYGEEYINKLKKMVLRLTRAAPRNSHLVVDDIEAAVSHKYPDHVYESRQNIFARIFLFVMENMPYELYENIELLIARGIGYPVPKDVME